MSEENILTEEIAEQFLADPDIRGDLTEYTSMEDTAAEILSKYKGCPTPGTTENVVNLGFGGLNDLSESAAVSLSKITGNLSLSGLSSMSDSAAEALSYHKGDLYLNGLSELSDSAVASLSKHQGDLVLNYLESLSEFGAEALSEFKYGLYLGGLTEVSEKVAKALAKVSKLELGHEISTEVKNLILKNRETKKVLTKEIAEEFLNNASIDLTQFNQLDEDAAHVLSGINAPLRLGLIADLSDSAALNLASYCGYYLSINKVFGLSVKDNLSYQKLTKMMFDIRFENTKNALVKLHDLKGVDDVYALVHSLDLIVSNVISRMNGMDTDESQFLAAYELFFIFSSKHLHEVSPVENIEIWRSIVANYGLWVSGNPWKDEAERLRIGEWCNEVWKLSEAINNEITEICEPIGMESITPSLNYLLCKVREEFLDAKREWGFLEGLPR